MAPTLSGRKKWYVLSERILAKLARVVWRLCSPTVFSELSKTFELVVDVCHFPHASCLVCNSVTS